MWFLYDELHHAFCSGYTWIQFTVLASPNSYADLKFVMLFSFIMYILQESYIRDAIGSQLLPNSLMPAHAVSNLDLMGVADLFCSINTNEVEHVFFNNNQSLFPIGFVENTVSQLSVVLCYKAFPLVQRSILILAINPTWSLGNLPISSMIYTLACVRSGY